MAADNMSLVPVHSGLNAAQLLFHDDTAQPLRFGGGGNATQHLPGELSASKTRELSGFMDDKLLTSVESQHYLASQGAPAASSVYAGNLQERGGLVISQNWNTSGEASTGTDGDESEDEDQDDQREELDQGGHSKDPLPSFVILGQPGSTVDRESTGGSNRQRIIGHFPNGIPVGEHDDNISYAQFMQGSEGPDHGRKDVPVDHGCGFSGRKDTSTSSTPGELLRAIFSDPITGTLMDDAMILSCGHSFGGGGIQQVFKVKHCYTCSQPVTQDLMSPNLSLRTAVQAFRREEEQMHCANKRRRERFGQVKTNCTDSAFMDSQRARGVQFPFVVTDRVIIKGNKRTPERFVGREAIVTKQCLNGWYVVKTLDNAESVKLQYRSLAKIPDNSTSNPLSDRVRAKWL